MGSAHDHLCLCFDYISKSTIFLALNQHYSWQGNGVTLKLKAITRSFATYQRVQYLRLIHTRRSCLHFPQWAASMQRLENFNLPAEMQPSATDARGKTQ